MSRIGRLPITVPAGVDVTIDGADVTVKGPKGTLSHTVPAPITVEKAEDGTLKVTRPNDERMSRSLHGLTRTLVANMVAGVTEGYTKKLEIVGTGYRVVAKGTDLEFALGFSHPVVIPAPEGITLRRRDADPVLGLRDRQAAGRRGRREPAQASQARPVQGQGRALRGRSHSPQGRKGRSLAMAVATKIGSGSRTRVARSRRHLRVRKKVAGTSVRPRMVVNRSTRHLFVQVVDDTTGTTLAWASTMEADLRSDSGDKTAKARKVGELVADRAKSAGIETVVFDRGGNKYHGRVAALADGARDAGLAF